MDLDFNSYLDSNAIEFNKLDYSESLVHDLKIYYDKYNIKFAPLTKYSEVDIREKCDRIVLRDCVHKVYNNIGPNPLGRFCKYKEHKEWLKLLIIYINQIYGFANNYKNHELCTFMGNKKAATIIGYISKDEKNPDIIKKASRKITDSIDVLIQEGYITREHIHKPGKRGSKHKIRINWIRVIELFQEKDYNRAGSIRLRKTIRYRIITFVKNTKQAIKNFQRKYRKFLDKQASSYLKNVVTFNIDQFKQDRHLIFGILKTFKYLATPKSMLNTNYIVPEVVDYNMAGKSLNLRVKSDIVYKDFRGAMFMLIQDFEEKYNIKLQIEPAFSIKNSVLI